MSEVVRPVGEVEVASIAEAAGDMEPPLRRCDKAAEDSEDGPTSDAPAVPTEEGEAFTRFPRMSPMASWASRRVRRMLVPNFGARFGSRGSFSTSTSQNVSHAQTQTLPGDDIEDTQCRRCRRLYRRRPTIRDEPYPLDQKAVGRSSLTSTTSADPCPVKASASTGWSARLAESFLAVVSEVLQYPWGGDALLLVGIVLLASLLVILYYVVAVVLPIMVLAVALAMANYALFESNRFAFVLRRLRLA